MDSRHVLWLLPLLALLVGPPGIAAQESSGANISNYDSNSSAAYLNNNYFSMSYNMSPGYGTQQNWQSSAFNNTVAASSSGPAKLVFDDEFSGGTLNMSKWSVCYANGYCYNPSQGGLFAQQSYAVKQNCVVANGVLDLMATKGNATHPYFSCIIQTHGKFDFTYGYAEARIWLPNGDDSWSAFWMLPSGGGWPPETDIAEQITGGAPVIQNYYYSATNPYVNGVHATPKITDPSGSWHLYAVSWNPDNITFYIDGNVIDTHTRSVPDEKSYVSKNVTSNPMYLVLDLVTAAFGRTPSKITQYNFTYSNSCQQESSVPSYKNGNYIVLYPSTLPSGCGYELSNIEQMPALRQRGFSFTGTFAVGGTAPNPSDEETIMSQDDIINWTGQGYGFRTSLSNDTIYAFVQDGTGKAGGSDFYSTVPLMSNDGKQHKFEVSYYSTNNTNGFYFYIDGALKGTITRYSSVNYSDQSYHLVMTTHRWDGNWSSGNSYLTVNGLAVASLPAPAQVPESMLVDYVRVWQNVQPLKLAPGCFTSQGQLTDTVYAGGPAITCYQFITGGVAPYSRYVWACQSRCGGSNGLAIPSPGGTCSEDKCQISVPSTASPGTATILLSAYDERGIKISSMLTINIAKK